MSRSKLYRRAFRKVAFKSGVGIAAMRTVASLSHYYEHTGSGSKYERLFIVALNIILDVTQDAEATAEILQGKRKLTVQEFVQCA
jgi:hypothetical protein